VLEINQIPGRDLRALIELIGERRLERELNVHRTTIRRWLAGTVQIPGAQHLAIKGLLGDLPGTCGKWTGWRFHDGLLYSPAGDHYRPGEVLAICLNRQIYNELAREVRAMKLQLAELKPLPALEASGQAAIAPNVFQVPGVPAVVQTTPMLPPAAAVP
jgi:hypothetical protein